MVNLTEPISSYSRPIFIDASVWIAWVKEDDYHHSRAVQLLGRQFSESAHALTSNLILTEVLTVLSMRMGKDRAVKFGNWLFQFSNDGPIGYVYIDSDLEQKTWELFRSIGKKNISFTDCSSAIVADEYDSREILTFDQDFKVFERHFSFNIIN